MMTTINSRTKWILLAAIAAVPVAGMPASAQYQSQNDGSALDANRRVGGDHRNSTAADYRVDTRINAIDRPTGNQIVTGNVTGNRQFRGDVGYTDASAFRGNTASDVSDNFIRSSSGTAGAAIRRQDYNVSLPFYPSGRTVQAPQGFVQSDLAGGGYLPRDIVGAAGRIDNRIDRGSMTPRGDSLILNGPVQPQGSLNDQAEAASLLTASPLLGVQQTPYGTQPNYFSAGLTAQRGLLDQATVDRMRNELRPTTPSGAEGTGTETPNLLNPPSGEQGTGNTQGQGTGGRGIGGPDTTGARAGQPGQSGGPISAQPLGGQTVDSSAATALQSTRQRILPTPGEQTPAYAELRRKLDQYANDKTLTDEQAFRAAQQARQQAELAQKNVVAAQQGTQQPNPQQPAQPGQPQQGQNANPQQPGAEGVGLKDFARQNEQILKGGTGTGTGDANPPGRLPGGDVTPAPLPPTGAGSAVQPQTKVEPERAPKATGAKGVPVKIDTLAKGVPGKGLADLLTGAESLMKEGKFASALEKYDQAEQVAPNNPLIKLGRANAELGASYFARADQHLREAFSADNALLMGQYDLRAFMGEDRLKVIANDLKDIANKEQAQVRPVFLLAYVAYNSGNERMAAGYLDLADKRAGGKDPLIKKIREHWTLPAAEEAPAEAAPAAEQPAPATPDRSEQSK